MRYTFLALFGPGSWLRNGLAAAFVFMAQGVAAYWGAAPGLTRLIAVAAAVLYVCDTVGGSVLAVVRKEFDSGAVGHNLMKLLAYLLSIIAGCAVGEVLAASGLAEEVVSRYTVTTWLLFVIALREGSSFVENSARLGFPWPRGLVDILARVKADVENNAPEESP